MKNTIEEIIQENDRRNKLLLDSLDGEPVDLDAPIDVARCREDFAYWAARAVKIRHKLSGRIVPFILNRAQREVIEILESKRRSGQPIRVIILKSRQWGASTLIMSYFSWIQLVHRRNWHSVICAHVKDTARTIRGMYSTLLENYPEELMDDDTQKGYRFAGFEGARNVRIITGRECRVTLATAENEHAVRGSDFSMAHLSEVAFWKSSERHDPADFLRAVCSSVPIEPYSVVVLESTANGVGGFFHNEWLRAVNGQSDSVSVFIPWYKVEMNSLPVDDVEAFWRSLNEYERNLWHEHRCSLDQINWYRRKTAGYPSTSAMHAEFPTTPLEAFVSSESNVFNNADIEVLRSRCRPGRRGDLTGGTFRESHNGHLYLWEKPVDGAAYVVAVDVGGCSDRSDWSVIAVVKAGVTPQVVAQWRGHIYHDLLARKAMEIGNFYNHALLVIESNTLETANESSSSAMVLNTVENSYCNVYRRQSKNGFTDNGSVGFHTNRHTKTLIIDNLMAAVREKSYVERCSMACDELANYCRLPNGAFQARKGCHDDILMTRAIALWVLTERSSHFCRNNDPYDSVSTLTW